MRSITIVTAALVYVVLSLSDYSHGRPHDRESDYVQMEDQNSHYARPLQRKRESPTIRRQREPRSSWFQDDRYRQRLVLPEDHTFQGWSESSVYQPPRQSSVYQPPRQWMNSPLDHKIRKRRYRVYGPEFGKYGDDHWQDDVMFRRQSRRMKGPHRKRENSLDKMIDGERVVIRYVPKLRNDNIMYYNSNEDAGVPLRYYEDDHEYLIPVSFSEACPYCNSKYNSHHNYYHQDEDNIDLYPSYLHSAIYENSPHLEDLSRKTDMETLYHKPTTTGFTRLEHPFSMINNHIRHHTYLQDIPEEHLMEEAKFEGTSPALDLQHPGKKGKQLEFMMTSDDNGKVAIINRDAGQDVGKELVGSSESPVSLNLEPLIETKKEDSNDESADVMEVLTKSPVSTEDEV